MSNYRRFSPYRQTYRSGNRMGRIVGWTIAAVVVVLLAKNVFTRGGAPDETNENSEVALVSNGNTNAASTAGDVVTGRDLSVRDCTKAISRASVDSPVVSITLDGGGIPGDASRALEAFKAKQVAPSLFVTGKWAEENRDIIKAYHDAGSDVYNHTYSHPTLTGMTADAIATELSKADTAIKDITGAETKPFFRPPFGTYDQASLAAARDSGYCTILWTVDAYDWKTGVTADETKARVLENLKNGAIIVLQANSDIVVDLVGPLIDEIRSRGYTIVPLKVLLRQQGDPPAEVEPVTTNVNAAKNTNTTKKSTNTNGSANTNATKTNTNANTNRSNNAT